MRNRDIRHGSEIYSPLEPSTISNPFPIFKKLRVEAPVIWHDGYFAWVVTRYNDCKRILGSPSEFPRNPTRLLGIEPIGPDNLTIQDYDPPEPLLFKLRQELARSIGQVDLKAICQDACSVLIERIAIQPSDHVFNFMSEVAAYAALQFACRLIGVPDLTVATYNSIFFRVTRAMDSALNEMLHGPGLEATQELKLIIQSANSCAPPGSIIHELNRNPRVKALPSGYVINTIGAMFNAAYSTAYTSMGSFLALHFEHPDLAKNIVKHGQLNRGVNELLRYTSPAQLTMRYSENDTVISGVNIKRADRLITLMGAANRDPNFFENPDKIVIERSPNPHLGFGWGPHFCIGAGPAQIFLESYVRVLADWGHTLKPRGELAWLNTATLRCLDIFPVSRLVKSQMTV